MFGTDTNMLVRFLVSGDEAQFERARKLIKRETSRGHLVFISLLVPLETECSIDKLRTERPQSVIDAGNAADLGPRRARWHRLNL